MGIMTIRNNNWFNDEASDGRNHLLRWLEGNKKQQSDGKYLSFHFASEFNLLIVTHKYLGDVKFFQSFASRRTYFKRLKRYLRLPQRPVIAGGWKSFNWHNGLVFSLPKSFVKHFVKRFCKATNFQRKIDMGTDQLSLSSHSVTHEGTFTSENVDSP